MGRPQRTQAQSLDDIAECLSQIGAFFPQIESIAKNGEGSVLALEIAIDKASGEIVTALAEAASTIAAAIRDTHA